MGVGLCGVSLWWVVGECWVVCWMVQRVMMCVGSVVRGDELIGTGLTSSRDTWVTVAWWVTLGGRGAASRWHEDAVGGVRRRVGW